MPMDTLPDYIDRRIRRPVPLDASVVAGSTPVVSFGNSLTATVATLGLNPSRVEFLDRHGNELSGDDRRLATHSSLGTDNLVKAPTDVVAQVLADCNSYFIRNPYRRWFDQLELVLSGCGGSYYNGTACHLDLVQWATNPTWGRLPSKSIRCQLLDADAAFLTEQLSNENIKVLLVNGSGVIRQLKHALNIIFTEHDAIIGYGHHDTRLFTGAISGGTYVVAWSTNLQSSFGVSTDLRTELTTQVAALIPQTIFAQQTNICRKGQ